MPVALRLDAGADIGQVGRVDEHRGVLLDELALAARSGADVADQVGRVGPDPRRQVTGQTKRGRESLRGWGGHDDAQRRQAGEARPQLVHGAHAGGALRQKLLDVAAEVPVEVNHGPGGRNREHEGRRPEAPPVPQRPTHKATRPVAGTDGRFSCWSSGSSGRRVDGHG